MEQADDLRARIESQKAARRQAGAAGRHAVGPAAGDSAVDTAGDPAVGSRHRRAGRARGRRFSGPVRALLVLLLAVLFALGLREFVVAPYYVPSGSMESTLHGCAGCNDDRVLVNKLAYTLTSVHRGDVVVFNRPDGAPVSDKVLVKRVVGLPGEALSIRNGAVYIDDRKLSEPYVNKSCTAGTQPETQPATIVVPAHTVYVMGDNRCDSTDSRTFGPVRQSLVIGRAFIIVWPLGRIHWL